MTAGKRCMVDTNVVVYSTVASSPWHQESRQLLDTLLRSGVELCITPQIVREYLVVLTRGDVFEEYFAPEDAMKELESILPSFTLVEEKQETLKHLCHLIQRYGVRGKAIHDANIVAAMLTHGVTHLVTYNSQDFHRFREITIEPIPGGKGDGNLG